MTKIINNNLWSPVPWGWGCNGCNGGNNLLNDLFGCQIMFGMMNNMFSNLFAPQQKQQRQQTYNPYGSFYPGLSLGATQGNTNTTYEEYMERMQAQNDLAQLKQTWNEFKFSNIGGKFQAVLKADKSVILDGDTTDELMSNIIGYVNENPAQFKTKEKEGAGGLDESSDGNEAAAGNDTGDGNVAGAGTGTGAGDGNAAGAGTGTGAGDGAGAVNGNVSGARSFKRATLDNNKYHWSTYKQLDHNSKKLFEVGMTAEQVLYKSIPAAKNWSQGDKDKYIQYIKDVNPTAIDKDGKVVNLDKLDLILVNQKSEQKTLKQTMALQPGSSCVYDFYDKDGNKISEKDFASKYPRTYLGKVATLKKKYWAPEDLRYALELYDQYIGGVRVGEDTNGNITRSITKNNFKKFEIRNDNDGTHLWCDFKGYRSIYANYTFNANNKGYFYGCLSDYYSEADLCHLSKSEQEKRKLTKEQINKQLYSK